MRLILRASVAALLAATTTAAVAAFPEKPVTIVVPFAAGGPTDTLARTLAGAKQARLKQTVVIENVGGAGGTIGVGRVARAANDGYTLLLHHIGMSTAPALYRKLPFNAVTDFEPIGEVADVPMTLIAKSTLPPATFPELVSYIKANRDKVSLANAGLGAASHLCGLLFMSAIQTDLVTVPYKGTGPAMNDLLGGQVDIMCDQTTNTTQQIRAGKVKAYGVTTRTRVPSLPDLRTLDEQGLKGFEVSVWHGLYAPRGTPKAVIDTLTRALQDALKDPAVRARFAELGTEPATDARATPESLRRLLTSEIAKWGPIIQRAGQYAD